MGILAYFEKVSDDEDTVTYRVGACLDDMPELIRLDKKTCYVLPTKGPVRPYLLSVAQTIVKRWMEVGVWPEHGVKAS